MQYTAIEVQNWLCNWLSTKLKLADQSIDPNQPFASYGVDSLLAVELSQAVQDWLKVSFVLDATVAWEYPTPATLAQYVSQAIREQKAAALPTEAIQSPCCLDPQHSIAIVGMGLRFPGAVDTPERFWQLLCAQQNPVVPVPVERLNHSVPGKSSSSFDTNATSYQAAMLSDIDQFDAHFFGISAQLAQQMDPQHRLLLEVCWEALEDAGIAPESLAGTQSGVFVGISTNDYALLAARSADVSPYRGLGNAHAIAANQISYLLDLRGPSMAIDTACSSSLVAVHQACASLRSGEIDCALVGGVNLALTTDLFATLSQAQMLSEQGRCATFDAGADGYVRGEGAAMIVLKRLSDAQRDGDRILALIRGSAVNQDGRSNGLTAPSGQAQQAVIQAALRNAQVFPHQISYVEAHGTGTPLGDPIEVNSLRAVLMEGRHPDQLCWIGAVKSQIGHLEAAAGIAGLIKTVLCLQHRTLPGNPQLKTINPHIRLEGTALRLLKETQAWTTDAATPRLAGVSSFGFGGTNAHVILEEAAAREEQTSKVERPLHLLTLSAKSEAALRSLAAKTSDYLHTHPNLALADLCHTNSVGRNHFEHRLTVIGKEHETLRQELSHFAMQTGNEQTYRHCTSRSQEPIVFLFTGQGAQYVEMGSQLYRTQPVFRQTLERCDAILGPLLGNSLLELLYPAAQNRPHTTSPDQSVNFKSPLNTTAYAQPALFALEYALYECWRSWGITPDLVIGHSLGEYVAACVAGVFTLEEGLKLVAARGKMMQALPATGSMATIFASAAQVAEILAPGHPAVEIAAINAPQNVVISGPREAVERACSALAQQAIDTRPLQVSHAFHSAQIEPMLGQLAEMLRSIPSRKLQLPLISNLTGKILPVGTELDADYWCAHARQPVHFMSGLQQALAASFSHFLEIGPSGVLVSFGKQIARDAFWQNSLQRGIDDWQVMLSALSHFYLHGRKVDWAAFDQDYACRRIAIPTYPFQRQRYWLTSFQQLSPGTYESNQTNHQKLNTDGHISNRKVNQMMVNHSQNGSTHSHTQAEQTILHTLRQLTAQLLHLPLEAINPNTPLLELGADSLILLEAIRQIESRYEVKLSVRSFFEELSTLDALASHLAEQTANSASTSVTQWNATMNNDAPTARSFSHQGSSLREVIALFERQIEALQSLANQQIELLHSVANQSTTQTHSTPTANTSPASQPVVSEAESNPASQRETAAQTEIKTVPLSEAQQQLWFLSQLSDEAAIAYNESVSLKLCGNLRVAALQSAIQSLVERHEALRTIIDGDGDLQHILPSLAIPLSMVDFSTHADTAQAAQIADWFAAESLQPMDLTKGPLFRVFLLRVANDEHILVLTAHHIIIDGMSMGILLRELSELYTATCRGTTAHLPAAVQFSEHIAWQQRRLASGELAEEEAYWLQALSGDLPMLELPLDRPRPAQQSYRGAIESLHLDAELSQALLRFSHQQGSTLFMTLLAAYFTLIHRLSGQAEVIVGVPTASRSLSGGETIVGYCTHLLPIRNQLADTIRFAQLLHNVRNTLLCAYEHADYPFAHLVNRLISQAQVSRDLSLSPILNSTFNLTTQAIMPHFADLQVTIGDRPTSFVDHELSVNVLDNGSELEVDFEYNADLFEAVTVQRIAAHFETLLRAIVSDSSQPVQALPLLNAAQRQQLLNEWNRTDKAFDTTLGFHQLFEAQVAKSPDAVAVLFNDEQISYAQLNTRANGIAHQLRQLGVGRDVLVAILTERSPDFLATMIGIFKAGGAYLPLDVRAPAARQSQILTQSRTPLLLISADFATLATEALSEMPAEQRPQIMQIEALQQSSTESENLTSLDSIEDVGSRLAYVIYTSGSTGLPKGAMVEQRGMINHLFAKIADLQLCATDTVAQTAPQSFDISVWQFLSTLILGGRVHIFPDEIAGDPRLLLQQSACQRITILEVVPSLLRMMLDEAEEERVELPNLRWMIPTGEALPPSLARRWMLAFPNVPMVNAYGPTECSDDVTHYPIFAPPAESVVNMPIGRPIMNMRMYILDAQLQPVPIGVVGELYVGGIGVGRGYIHDAERTALAFVPDPFSVDLTSRLYKTGDKARYLADGNIEYLGRLDYQVKIRGFRIELGEIEAVLERHPSVYQSVVIDRADSSGNKQLIAYVVLNEQDKSAELRNGDERSPIAASLRRYMVEHLPDYMVPSAFVVLDVIPLTANGKTDRKSLPQPIPLQSAESGEIIHPRTPTERSLVSIWSEVLHLQPEQVSIHHDFFELGGHSLLATQAVARIRHQFAIDLPLRSYFNEPTIAGLATLIDAVRWATPPTHTLVAANNQEREIGELL